MTELFEVTLKQVWKTYMLKKLFFGCWVVQQYNIQFKTVFSQRMDEKVMVKQANYYMVTLGSV